MGGKVNNFRKMKIPYTVIIGNEEIANHSISLKIRGGKQVNNIPMEKFIRALDEQVANKNYELVEDFE